MNNEINADLEANQKERNDETVRYNEEDSHKIMIFFESTQYNENLDGEIENNVNKEVSSDEWHNT